MRRLAWGRQLTLLLVLGLASRAPAHERLAVRWEPGTPRQGDLVLAFVSGAGDGGRMSGTLGGRTLAFFPAAGGHAALAGIDLETRPGALPWRIRAVDQRGNLIHASGALRVQPRAFPVQRLTLPRELVELDEPTLRRVEEESRRLHALWGILTPERLWRGAFAKPVEVTETGEGFGARRTINGQPRAPHAGVDYPADPGTAVVAANAGQVALVAEHFFPGRLVVLDHGLGLFTLYFHLDRADVPEGARVERGQPIGTVGATGRATGPHLHFAVHVGPARVDPAALLNLSLSE